MTNEFSELDFFRGSELIENPYPYYEALRQRCPVTKESHHNVTMITGWDEACAVLNDAETWSSCISVTGPFPGFPVPLEGDDVTELIERHRDDGAGLVQPRLSMAARPFRPRALAAASGVDGAPQVAVDRVETFRSGLLAWPSVAADLVPAS